MPKTKIILSISILILATIACNAWSPKAEPTAMVVILEPTFPPQPSDLPATENDVPRVSLIEALVAMSAGTAIFVDVRSPDSFASSHIAGAINIPLNEIESNPTGLALDKDQWIITYCT